MERPTLAEVIRYLELWIKTSPEPRESALLMLGAATGVALKYLSVDELRNIHALRELFER